MMSYTYISTPEKQLALLALLVKMREFCENSLKWKLFEPGSSTRDSGGEAICPHGWHSALGTHTSTILYSGPTMWTHTSSLLWGHPPLLFSALGNLYYSLLLDTSTILCPATHLFPTLLCSVSLCPGHNCHQGPILSRAVCSTGHLGSSREKRWAEKTVCTGEERKSHSSVPVKTHFVHSPHQPPNFSSGTFLTDNN